MSHTKTSHAKTPPRHTPSSRNHRPAARRRIPWAWLGVLVPLVGLVALVIAGGGGGDGSTATTPGDAAPLFSLPATDGSTVSLDVALESSDVLLYFSMGVGCDGCFAQIPEVDQALADRGIELLPIMVQDAEMVQATAELWGIERPILIDADLTVSEAYDMMGVNGHMASPFHSIALVRQDGTVAFAKHYDSMFVGASEMLADLGIL